MMFAKQHIQGQPPNVVVKQAIQIFVTAALLFGAMDAPRAQQSRLPSPQLFTPRERVSAPIVLCIDDDPKGGGQPSADAYAKAAANGFRSVVTLRTAADGVDMLAERLMVERNRLRHFNIPATTKLPSRERVDEFLRLTRDEANHPMLINCAYAERVAPLMLIFRIVEQGWSQEKALKEATASGLKAEPLKQFAAGYLGQHKSKAADAAPANAGKTFKPSKQAAP